MSSVISKSRPSDLINTLGRSSFLKKISKVDPKDRYVVLFPDESKFRCGFGSRLLASDSSEAVYRNASEIVRKDILKICLEEQKVGGIGKSFEDTYLATFVTSQATIARHVATNSDFMSRCAASAGVGIGLMNSLVLSESISFEDACEFVQKFGQAMNEATKLIPTARIKLGLKPATKRRLVTSVAMQHCLKLGIPAELAVCAETRRTRGSIMEVAGHIKAIEYLENEGERLFGFKYIHRIRHCPTAQNTSLMTPVRGFLEGYMREKFLGNSNYIQDPVSCSVYSSLSGVRLRYSADVQRDLLDLPVKPLKIEQLFHTMFTRPATLAQPNILVCWDKQLMTNLKFINRRAGDASKMLTC